MNAASLTRLIHHCKKKRVLILIFIIFLIAFLVRTYKIGEVPYSLHQDELVNAYAAKFILINGKDLWGNTFPLEKNEEKAYERFKDVTIIDKSNCDYNKNVFDLTERFIPKDSTEAFRILTLKDIDEN